VEAFCLTPVIVLSLLRGWCVACVGDESVEFVSACGKIKWSQMKNLRMFQFLYHIN
jgi:hypothetical protein